MHVRLTTCLCAIALALGASPADATVGLYMTEAGLSDSVFRVNSDGTNEQFIVPGVPGDPSVDPRGLAVDAAAGKVYFIRSLSVLRCNLDGTALETIASISGGSLLDVEIDPAGGRVYWTSRSASSATTGIFSRMLDLSDVVPTPLMTQAILLSMSGLDPDVSLADVHGIEIADGRMYWSNGDTSASVNSVTLSSSSPTNVFTTVDTFSQFDIDDDADKIYWTGGGAKIQRADLAADVLGGPSGLEIVRDFGSGAPGSIAVDVAADTMYYTRSNRLWSLDTAGLGTPVEIHDFATTVLAPTDLEITTAIPEPTAAALLCLSSLLMRRRNARRR